MSPVLLYLIKKQMFHYFLVLVSGSHLPYAIMHTPGIS